MEPRGGAPSGVGRSVSEVSRVSRAGGGRGAVVPDVEMRSYYGQPVIKQPVWTWEIPWYFFTGGLAGASSLLALGARLAGNRELATAARRAAAVGAVASPALLVSDLGRPERFLNMLRVFRPTSPMSMGSWVLAAYGPAAGAAWLLGELDRLPGARRLAEGGAAALGSVLATYTAGLVADTAVPVWHEARRELPFAFAGGSLASAGAAAAVLTRPERAAPARRMAVLGAVTELGATKVMEQRLGALAAPYEEGETGRLTTAAKALTAAGAGVLALGGRRRWGSLAGGALVLAGAAAARWSVFRAGFASAADPRYTVEPQRARLGTTEG